MNAYAHLPEKNRYENIENIQRVNEGRIQEQRDGQIRNLFWIRRPAFDEYKDKNTTSLMWQLYLLVPSSEQALIRQAIQQSIRIDRLIPEIRFKAASEPERPPAKTKKDQDKQDEDENNLSKDFGQDELFAGISQLAEIPRWKNAGIETGR